MPKTLKRMSATMLASVALAAASLFAPAPAQAIDLCCHTAAWPYCSANWQALGFWDATDCYWYWYFSVCLQ